MAGDGGIEYRQFRPESVSCDAAVSYITNNAGLDVLVSAVVYPSSPGSGNWRITAITLVIGADRIEPDAVGRFYLNKIRQREYPAGVLIAAIDTMIEALSLRGKDPVPDNARDVGFGLLTDEASGDMSGENRVFALGWQTVDLICEGRDYIEIDLEEPDIKANRIIKIDLMKRPVKEERFDYASLRQDELMQIVETLRDQVVKVQTNRDRYKEGVDPEYSEMQGKIEDLEVERALAYKTWFERREY